MSPHSLVQELLNRTDEHLWAIVTNGLRLRLLRDNVALTRQAYVEFDLEAMFTGQAYADFALLWLVCHQSRFEADIPAKCLLEQWTLEANERGTRALDQLRVGVEAAISALGEGFLAHPANAQLRHSLEAGELDKQDYYRQLLRTVYRLLFLLVAEGRDLLLDPGADATASERYRSFYSLSRLRALADARRGTTHGDQWAGLQLVMHALGENGEPALGLPGLGSFLWKPQATPDLDGARLDNRHLLRAIRSLSMTAEGGVTRSVDYRNLGAEELGSIYESLLELHPVVDVAARTFALSTAGGNERKTTGSYYTPTSLITELLDSALEPVLDEAASAADPEAALLAVTVLDPACGSGHFLIAAAHRIAKRLASVRSGDGEPSPPLVQEALREVVATCVHGIDVNEMAVELCKVSLWMEALVPGKPLAFLEHRIVCGNFLLGTTPRLLARGVPDEAFGVLTGDDKATVVSLRKANKAERSGQGVLEFGNHAALAHSEVARGFAAIDAEGDDTITGVEGKEHRWLSVIHGDAYARSRLAADAWCSSFVALRVPGAPRITTSFVREAERKSIDKLDQTIFDAVNELQRQYKFLHLHLAFPDVFGLPADLDPEGDGPGWDGGFDVVLGNPPWERLKLQEKEFFAARSPEIVAATTASHRTKLIEALADSDPSLWQTYQRELRTSDGEALLIRESGRFPLSGRGDVNTYGVFLESAWSSTDPSHGRVGLIVPSGIATDFTMRKFFAKLFTSGSLVSLYEFENNGFFLGIGQGHMVRFCLLTIGPTREKPAALFMFQGADVSELLAQDRAFQLEAADLELMNPNTRTCPIFKNSRNASISRAIYRRVPVLMHEGEHSNPWDVSFLPMFHSKIDAHLFVEEETAGYVPLYEAKMVQQYNHRHGDYGRLQPGDKGHILPSPSESELADPNLRVATKFFVPSEEVDKRLSNRGWSRQWLFGWRDIADSRASARTFVSPIVPRLGTKDKLQLMLSLVPSAEELSCLVGSLNSFIFDFSARQKVGGLTINYFILKQLPVLPPATYRSSPWLAEVPLSRWIGERVLELTYTSWDLAGFAQDLGHTGPPFRWQDERRALLRSELDACFFHLYGIERDDVDYILETFPIVRRKDEAAFGEYRTKRLILEVFDAMAEAIASGKPYQTIIDQPPADPSLCHLESTRPEWAKQS